MEQREAVRAFLTEQGYREFPVHDIDRHDANWQRRSGVERDNGGAEVQRGYLDIRAWWHEETKRRHPELAEVLCDGYEIGATFETPHGWLNLWFYALDTEQLMERLPAVEEEIRIIQRRLLGEQS